MPINQMPPDGGMLYKETDMAQFFHRYRTNPFVWLSVINHEGNTGDSKHLS